MKTAVKYPEREVKWIVIHCSATRCNVSLPAAQPGQKTGNGNSRQRDCHFYIRRNGQMCQIRPIGQPGRHTPGFDRQSIGICYEGGRNSQGRPADTRTRWQKDALDDLLAAIRTCFPAAVVVGRDRLSGYPRPASPCFEADKEYATNTRP